MVKKILGFLIFLFISILFPVSAQAAGEFATSYDVLYDVGSDGVTTVTEKITLRNLTSQYYANQFKITIGSTQISDIKAADSGGSLNVESEQKDSSTIISVKFNQQVAGMGKTLPWTLTFKSKDFAEKEGKVWEVRAPKISSSTDLDYYNLVLSVPQSFGEPSSISPTPKSQTLSTGKIFLTYDKDSLLSAGISANFGNIQLFDFDLTYHIQNSNLFPVLTNIALPPETAFQDVIYQKIAPNPINVTVDNDSNFLAWYRLERGQKLDVKLTGSAKLYTNSKVQNPYLDENLRKKYTKSDKYWEKNNPQISGKLSEILGSDPPKDTKEKVRLIFQFVVNYLKYDSSRLTDNIERLGAVTALNNPQSAVCMEFTDLFIALARSAGVPARELDGFAYSVNTTLRPLSLTKDILHSWPEYWDDKRGWTQVDPTWENTTGGVDYFNKLDLNHFVFAVKGWSSSQPIPAGSYKYIGEDSHDVKVTLAENDFLGKPQVDVQISAANPILSGFPGRITIKVSNLGNALYPSQTLSVRANKLPILDGQGRTLGPIPPFGYAEFDFNTRSNSLFDAYDDQILLNLGNQKFTKDVKISPFLLFQTVPLVIGAILSAMVLIYLSVLGFHFYRQKLSEKNK